MWLTLLKVKCISFVKQLKQQLYVFDYSYEINLGKILGLLFCLKLDVYCLLAVTCVAKVKRGQEMIVTPSKGVSPRAACPKFQQHIRASVWSATLWTWLLPWAPLLPAAMRGNTQDPPRWAQGWVTAPLSSQPHCPLSVLSIPAHPGENGAGGGVGISVPKHSVCYKRPFFACAFDTTGYEMPPPLLSWTGNNWGICW